MTAWTIGWIALPFFVGFSLYLLPQVNGLLKSVLDPRVLALSVPLISAAYAVSLFWQPVPLNLQLLDHFGVTLLADTLSAYFILTNALVTAAVILYCWDTGKTAFFYTQAVILHGSINAIFICADFISVYVALEVIGIAAFLLVAYPRSNRTLWVALRYLFVSNTAMLFYLMGAVLVYQTHESFAFTGLRGAPPEAVALILVGLLTKGGIFMSGLWLPLTHSEAESPVSALLSGVVAKAGVFPLVRCALLVEELEPLMQLLGVAAALLGVTYALVETDAKRVLACSTLSQVGWVLAVPEVAGFYALAHGVGKASLFLTVGNLSSRNLTVLQQQPISTHLWLPLTLASLSISGCPGLVGFGAKISTLQQALPWQNIALNVAATGTAALYAKFIFLPHQRPQTQGGWIAAAQPGLWAALALLLGSLLIANAGYPGAYTWLNSLKVLAIIGGGWLIHWLLIQRVTLTLPRGLEAFEHLIGGMSLMLIALFWMVWSWLAI
ncbi:cation:proton antiporter [Synechococcales cyanobacterium C]|uniref:Cation:proton antiporter n=1 Tax=Petrachloros mirabilis ULC683 TaxID=2781853 RepID=A0A8K2A9W1_9CYAN|nr:cation:proton antiporter [Petrachloros mirabilis]NCJ08480.1 cation:proton antiporter [Petrachloros mirabilis ULC683]